MSLRNECWRRRAAVAAMALLGALSTAPDALAQGETAGDISGEIRRDIALLAALAPGFAALDAALDPYNSPAVPAADQFAQSLLAPPGQAWILLTEHAHAADAVDRAARLREEGVAAHALLMADGGAAVTLGPAPIGAARAALRDWRPPLGAMGGPLPPPPRLSNGAHFIAALEPPRPEK
ncbi:MAG: hypothetical protein AAF909_05925 [Pseudomonadota bacterium]